MSNKLKYNEEVKERTRQVLNEIIELRHKIHQNPEIAYCEFETSKLVKDSLSKTDISFYKPFIETDVVGILNGKTLGKNVTLRADMDALPIMENTLSEFTSKNKLLMHACGHDGHTAVLIGVAKVLDSMKDKFNGSVRFIFQPGEEVVAAGKKLVENGVLLDPKPDLILSIHGYPLFPTGTIVGKKGVFMGAADFFELEIKGVGAHGSAPEVSIDPILTSAKIIEGFQSIVSRRVSPLESVVISVCSISGGNNANVIPCNVTLKGTTRYFNKSLADKIPQFMEDVINGICLSTGASYDFKYNKTYIPLINTDWVVELCEDVVKQTLGDTMWKESDFTSMAGEDFAYYLQDYPGAMFFLGLGEDSAPLHNPAFNFNDDAIQNAIAFFVSATLKFLE